MPQKTTKEEADEYESFARAALGKRADPDPPKKKAAAPVDTARVKTEMGMDLADYKSLRSERVRGDADPAKDAQARAAFNRAMARDDTLRTARRKGTK